MQEDDDLISITGGPLKPHEYVLIKPYMDAGDDKWIQNHSAKARGQGKETEVVLTIGDVKMASAQRMIKGWSLTKTIKLPDGGTKEIPLPFSAQNIEKLPLKIYHYILKKIDEMNPDEEEGGDEAFLPSVVDSSEENFQAERVFRLKA
jgi:hypothetical protein